MPGDRHLLRHVRRVPTDGGWLRRKATISISGTFRDPSVPSRSCSVAAPVTGFLSFAFHPKGTWMAAQDFRGLSFWPLTRSYPHVLRRTSDLLQGCRVPPSAESGWPRADMGDPRSRCGLSRLPSKDNRRELLRGFAALWLSSTRPRANSSPSATDAGVWLVVPRSCWPCTGAATRIRGFHHRRRFRRGRSTCRRGRRSSRRRVRCADLGSRERRRRCPGCG